MNRLPPEVLTSCVTFVSDTDPRPIVSLTHVCRYWRSSISTNPRNWALISTGWKRLAPLCLERAGAVPLAIDITVSDVKSGEDFLELLIPKTSRIFSLRLTGYPLIEVVAGALPGFFDQSMPNLTSLELQQTTEPTESLPLNETPVPPVFRNITKLESLRLTRTPLYPPLFNITSLRELQLLGYTNPLHFGTFIGFLDSNRDLEHVVFDVQFVTDSVETVPARAVPLPHLRHLSVTCHKEIDSKLLLSSISFSRGGVRIDIIFAGLDQSINLGSFLPSPPTPIQDLLAPINTIKSQFTPQELQVFGNGSVFTFRSPKAVLGVHPEFGSFSSTTVREFHANIRPVTYHDITVLWVLERLPALETLAFSGTEFPLGLIPALTKEPVLCPALRTIALFDCDPDPDIITELGEAITKRRNSTAAPLHRVVIVSSTGAPPNLASIQQLRKCVPRVEVRVDDELPDLA